MRILGLHWSGCPTDSASSHLVSYVNDRTEIGDCEGTLSREACMSHLEVFILPCICALLHILSLVFNHVLVKGDRWCSQAVLAVSCTITVRSRLPSQRTIVTVGASTATKAFIEITVARSWLLASTGGRCRTSPW